MSYCGLSHPLKSVFQAIPRENTELILPKNHWANRSLSGELPNRGGKMLPLFPWTAKGFGFNFLDHLGFWIFLFGWGFFCCCCSCLFVFLKFLFPWCSLCQIKNRMPHNSESQNGVQTTARLLPEAVHQDACFQGCQGCLQEAEYWRKLLIAPTPLQCVISEEG